MSTPPSTRRDSVVETVWLTRLLWLLAIGLAVNSILGPLALHVIEYHYTDTLINQGIGLDAVALFAATPLAIIAALLVARGHPAGPVLAFSPATFAAYMAPQYIVGPDYLALPGNKERFFLFHIIIFIVGIATAIAAWRTIDRSQLRPDTDRSDRRSRPHGEEATSQRGPAATRDSAAAAAWSAQSSSPVLARFDSPIRVPMHLYRAAISLRAPQFRRVSRGFRRRGGTGGAPRG